MVKDDFMLLKNIQIKYARLGNCIRNNFPHWSFLKFGMEFELKIWEGRVYFSLLEIN
jgi:hypothetical protein